MKSVGAQLFFLLKKRKALFLDIDLSDQFVQRLVGLGQECRCEPVLRTAACSCSGQMLASSVPGRGFAPRALEGGPELGKAGKRDLLWEGPGIQVPSQVLWGVCPGPGALLRVTY